MMGIVQNDMILAEMKQEYYLSHKINIRHLLPLLKRLAVYHVCRK
jgi:hypothetical protein